MASSGTSAAIYQLIINLNDRWMLKAWTVVVAEHLEQQPTNQEIVGLNPAGSQAFTIFHSIFLPTSGR